MQPDRKKTLFAFRERLVKSMGIKQISSALTAAAMLAAVTVTAAPVSAASAASGSSAPQSASSGMPAHRGPGCHAGCCGSEFRALAKVSGISAQDLMTKYPQKTAWQIAKQLGKLDDLKKEYLSMKKTVLDGLVADGRITAEDGAAIYTDLQKRVAAIDGVNTVILGRPGFMMQKKAS